MAVVGLVLLYKLHRNPHKVSQYFESGLCLLLCWQKLILLMTPLTQYM